MQKTIVGVDFLTKISYFTIEKCNNCKNHLWGKAKIMEIKRDRYLEKLIKHRHNGLVKIITGIRRCGKSYLLNKLFYRYLLDNGIKENHIIKFAFDSADDLALIGEKLIDIQKKKRKVDPDKFIEYIKTKVTDNQMYYLLLDEVQMLDAFESVLNGYLRNDNMDVFVTGSNAKLLSKDIVTEFAGRGDEIHMQPLSFSEFMSVYKGDKYEGLSQYMLYGGIPLVVLANDNSDKVNLLQRLFEETYIRDIEQRYKIRNKSELEELLNVLSSSIGSLTNPEKLCNTFRSVKKSKITAATLKKYLDALNDSFLIDSVNRYDIKGKSYIASLKKYYFSDLGLRNARINFRQIEQTHSMENIIYNELKFRGLNVDVGVITSLEKNSEGKYIRKQLEVDFVCNQGTLRYYIQSAFSLPDKEKQLQETRPFTKIEDSFKKIIVTHDMIPKFYNEEGILTVNIYDFLLDESIFNE